MSDRYKEFCPDFTPAELWERELPHSFHSAWSVCFDYATSNETRFLAKATEERKQPANLLAEWLMECVGALKQHVRSTGSTEVI